MIRADPRHRGIIRSVPTNPSSWWRVIGFVAARIRLPCGR